MLETVFCGSSMAFVFFGPEAWFALGQGDEVQLQGSLRKPRPTLHGPNSLMTHGQASNTNWEAQAHIISSIWFRIFVIVPC